MCCMSQKKNGKHLTLRNCEFKNCISRSAGGAIFCGVGSTLVAEDCVFSNNIVFGSNGSPGARTGGGGGGGGGAGMGGSICSIGSSQIHVIRCRFENNIAIGGRGGDADTNNGRFSGDGGEGAPGFPIIWSQSGQHNCFGGGRGGNGSSGGGGHAANGEYGAGGGGGGGKTTGGAGGKGGIPGFGGGGGRRGDSSSGTAGGGGAALGGSLCIIEQNGENFDYIVRECTFSNNHLRGGCGGNHPWGKFMRGYPGKAIGNAAFFDCKQIVWSLDNMCVVDSPNSVFDGI